MAAKPGKWAWLKGKYPTLPEDPTFKEVVAAAQAQHRGKTLAELAETYAVIEAQKEKATADISGHNADLEALERLMQDALEAQDIEFVKVAGRRISSHTEVTAKVTDPEQFNTWAREHMADNYSIPYQTLQASVKRDLEAGHALPPGIEVFTHQNVSCKKA